MWLFSVKNNQKNIKILAVCPQTSQPSIISISHGYGVAILCTAQLPQDSQDEMLNSDTKGLLKLVLEHIGMTCGVADKPVLTIAYLLAEDEVNCITKCVKLYLYSQHARKSCLGCH